MRKIMESLSSLSSEEKDAAFEILKKIDFINVDKKIKKNDRKVSGVDFTGKTVRGFKLSGQNYTAHSYRDVYLNITQMVFKQNPQKKDRILSLQGRDRKYFSCNPIELTKDRVRIPDSDIYAELNENANTLYRRSKKILQLYGMDHESLEILTY